VESVLLDPISAPLCRGDVQFQVSVAQVGLLKIKVISACQSSTNCGIHTIPTDDQVTAGIDTLTATIIQEGDDTRLGVEVDTAVVEVKSNSI
jgi:hypothetical protein